MKNMNNEIRVRFAPSPTGFLHIGSLRTVLFDYLIAKTLGGKLILRIEDTDQKRKVPGAVESLVDILHWVGIEFDEGPQVGGAYGPYVQTERLDIYKKYAEQLLAEGQAYRCFCSAERLEEMRRSQAEQKLPPRYDRCCRDLNKEEIAKKIKAGEKFVVRQKMALAGEIIVYDELRGNIKFKMEDLEDQVLIKSDGIPTYHFAVVVDDHLMAISHVLRGDEWIPSFPKNILLYQSFGWQPPKFIHLTLTLNKGGGKLSKRQGDVAVEDYRTKGYLPQALLNFCVLQGWHPSASDKAPKDKTDEILSLSQMIEYFDYRDMGTSPAIFDIEKLDYFNGYYIRKMDLGELTKMCLPFFSQAGLVEITGNDSLKLKNKITGEDIDFDRLKEVVALEQERLKKISEIGELTGFFFADELEYEKELLIWKKNTPEQTKNNLQKILELLEKVSQKDWTQENLEQGIVNYLKAENLKLGDYLWPMRVALTGCQASPGPFEVAAVLGRAGSLKRIKKAMEKI